MRPTPFAPSAASGLPLALIALLACALAPGCAWSSDEIPTTCNPKRCVTVAVSDTSKITGQYDVTVQGIGSTTYSGNAPTDHRAKPFSPRDPFNPNVAKVQADFNTNANLFVQQVQAAVAALEAPMRNAARICESSCACAAPEGGGNTVANIPLTFKYPDFGAELAGVVNASSTPFPPNFPPATGTATMQADVVIVDDITTGKCKPQ